MGFKSIVVCCCVILACFATTALSWGSEGHKIVAQIAADRLSSTVKKEVAKFLGSKTLPDIAPLPDNYDHSSAGSWSSPCHYCNLPRSATSFKLTYCDGLCVVKSIMNYTQILTKEASKPTACDYSTGVEPCALEFLVHYVGDVHQPLHVSYADDEGGNKVAVSFFGTSTNLHTVWDTSIISRWNSDLTSAVSELEGMMAKDPNMVQHYLNQMDSTVWANESYTYVLSNCYDFTSKNGVGQLSDAYYNTNLPIIQDRLIAAGVRLGQLINNALSVSMISPDSAFEWFHAFGPQL